MNSKLKQIFRGMIITSVFGVMMAFQVLVAYAASGRIAFSDKSVTVGSEVSINMKVTSSGGEALSNATVMLNYDASMLEFVSGTGASGGAGSIRITVGSDTANTSSLGTELKFKALQAGTAKVSVSTQEVYDASNQVVEITQMGNSTITVGALANASKDAVLTGLKISPGTLTPEFSPEVMSYTAFVGTDVDKITVSAPANDAKAKVVISGSEGLQMGENQVVCKVIAEDGQTVNDYVIIVTKAEGGESGSSVGTVETIDVVTAEKTVSIIPLDEGVEIPEGLKECLLKIDGQEVQGWVWASETDYQYCVFYGRNEAGEKGFYRYDIKEKTMQRYFMDPMSAAGVSMEQYTAVAEEYTALLKDYDMRFYIIIALILVTVVLVIILFVMIAKNGRPHDDDRYGNYKEKLRDERRPSRRATREEDYMRGLEAEEEQGELDKIISEEPVSQPKTRISSKVREEKHQVTGDVNEDDDFEFIDLGL